MNSEDKKRAGGAAREREKNKKLLLDSSKNCKKINSFFNSAYYEKQNPVKTEELSSGMYYVVNLNNLIMFIGLCFLFMIVFENIDRYFHS